MNGARGTTGWLAFWNGPRPIYVSERHRRVHYAKVADDILEVLPRPRARVLDFGCGAALEAGRVAEACARLYLCEAAETWRAELAERFRDHARIEVLDPDGLDALSDSSLDLIVVNSVLQYVRRAEIPALLRRFRAKLHPEGVLVLADLLPERATAVADAASFLRVAVRHGFLPAALLGLVRLLASDYRRLRREVGLTVLPPAEIAALLAEAGFEGRRRPVNFGFNQRRATYLARRSRPRGLERPVAVTEEGPDHHEAGRGHLREQVVEVQRAGEQGHERAGQEKADERHDRETRHGGLVGAVAREGPVAVEAVGYRTANEEPEHRREDRARAA
ncbi:MAG: class I SAM-dependent methyltransferase [Geminicoccaceae bacterium]|nr:class I SAM-dependent methyltransferase [Geminicoccaceae bacterium]